MSELSSKSTNRRPCIGIPTEVTRGEVGQGERKLLELPKDYAERVHDAGGLAVLLPCAHDAELREEMIGGLDGLLMPGGRYGPAALWARETCAHAADGCRTAGF